MVRIEGTACAKSLEAGDKSEESRVVGTSPSLPQTGSGHQLTSCLEIKQPKVLGQVLHHFEPQFLLL